MCCAFINIDLTAVGNWAERNNIAYASYQELAAHPRVYEMIQGHVEEVNRPIAAGPDAGGLPGAPVPDPAQGTRCR
jgi:long-chain acyl-CoA synthetase